MKKFYFFSKKKLKFVEINDFYKKFLILTLIFAALMSFLIFGVYSIINNKVNPSESVAELKKQNRELKENLENALTKYEEFEQKLLDISSKSNDLRIAVNLKPLDLNNSEIGTGGSIFENISISNSTDIQGLVNKLNANLLNISQKLNLEINNYREIETKISENKKLFNALPAIKPAAGPYGDSFGIRLHPILKIKRPHNGIDILVNTGSDVFATGKGKVIFAKRTHGMGYKVDIDHGFGYVSTYGHLSEILVKRGQRINRGDLIAKSGNTGRLSTGPHLHYEIRHKGVVVNPRNFIFDDINLFEIIRKK